MVVMDNVSPEKSMEAALLAASKWALNSGLLFMACLEPRGALLVGVSEPILAARIGWRRPSGAVLAPVAIYKNKRQTKTRKLGIN